MTRQPVVICVLILIIIILAWIAFATKRAYIPSPTSVVEATSTVSENEVASSTAAKNVGDTLEVTAPSPNAHLVSPLQISGQAKGSWYFEGQFPIELIDEKGNVLAQTTAQAASDWTNPGFVPFTAEITFAIPTSTPNGLLIFKKDNPSGDPSRDQLFAIPIIFK